MKRSELSGLDPEQRAEVERQMAAQERKPLMLPPPAELTIAMPLPPKELSPNARPNRWKLASARRSYRIRAKIAALAALGRRAAPRWTRATVRIRFFHTVNRRRDKDNLLASLKAAFDGLADAGVVENDSGMTYLPVEVFIDQDRPRVELTVRPEAT